MGPISAPPQAAGEAEHGSFDCAYSTPAYPTHGLPWAGVRLWETSGHPTGGEEAQSEVPGTAGAVLGVP